jgi:alpha-tubulin suppressor-like RCC1 family protein
MSDGSTGGATPASFKSVSAGNDFACAIRDDDTLVCWGDNTQGPPPTGTFTSVSTSGAFACGVRSTGIIACWGDNSYAQTMPPSR